MTSRPQRALALALLGFGLGILLAAGSLLVWTRWLASRPDELPYVPLAADKTLGINANLSHLNEAEREEALTTIEAAGFGWLRQRFPWEAIEPKRGAYDWTVWDAVVADAARHNLALIAILDGSPAWARAEEDLGNPFAPPAETRDFGDFVASFAARYGDQVDYYQIWDEPNIAPHWGAREIDPAAYSRLLREGTIRIRAVDSEATILAAALAPTTELGGQNMSDILFLDGLYLQGAAEWFDVVSAQPYDFREPIDSPASQQSLNWRRLELLRKVMEAHGDLETAVWAVSFGLMDPTPEAVNEAVEQAREDWPWLGPMFWAAWSPEDAHGQYALTGADRKPGTVYRTLQSLAQLPHLAWPGVYPADHTSGRFEGNWRVAPAGADIGGSGDRLIISFRGTRLDLIVRRGSYRAFLFASIDGQAANALPHDPGGRAYVVLYDPLQEVSRVPLARDLPDGTHVAEILAERGWGQWAIVGWAVSREMAGGIPGLGIGLSLVAVVVAGMAVFTAWPHREWLHDSFSRLLVRYRSLDDRIVLAITAGSAVLLYVMDGAVATVAALALLALVLLLRPAMGLPLIALALPFYQPGRPLLGKVFSMVEILTILTAVGWLINRVLGLDNIGKVQYRVRNADHEAGEPRDKSRLTSWVAGFTALDWGVLTLVVVGALSLLWAEHGRVAAREFRTVVLEAGIFYALLRVMVPARSRTDRKRQSVWRVVDAWVLGGSLIALIGLGQWIVGENLITAEGVWRVRGFYGSPNNLALYLGRVFPLCVAVAVWGKKEWRRWAYGLAASLTAIVIFLTYSRGAWLLGVPASLLFLVAMRSRRAVVMACGVLIVAAAIVLLVSGTGRLTALLDAAQGTTFFRLQLWQSSWAMLRDHPLLGVGLDNFLYHYRTHYVLPTAWEEFDLSHPHNLVLDFWLRLGLPGLLVFLWLIVMFFRQGQRAYRIVPESNERLLVLGAMAGMVDLVAHGLVDNAYFLVDLAFAFVLMLVLVQAVCDEEADSESNGAVSSTQCVEVN